MSGVGRTGTDLDAVKDTLARQGQEHVLAHWDSITDAQRDTLLADIARLNFTAIAPLIDTHVRREPSFTPPSNLEPAPSLPARPGLDEAGQYADAVKRGVELIRKNRVAAFTVAGGAGTRLGFDGPKGMFPISPVKNKSLFQLFAEQILGTNRRYGADLRWYVMTSPSNDAETRRFFEEHAFFGLSPQRVRFFQQGLMPAFDKEGRILLDAPDRIAFSPDGHGGSLLALKHSGALAEMAEADIEALTYIQVDNPLVHMIDPLFLGLHAMTGSEMSSKTIPKADDLERVGNFALADGKVTVIEYSDLPDELAHARNPDGSRKFDQGSIAIHILSRAFIERMTADEAHFGLPWHRAVKKVPYLDAQGRRIEPDAPNAIKLEAFIFDALPFADKPLILQTLREEEFSPVKNASGIDSAETARRDMNHRAAAWLESAGYYVPRKVDNEPNGLYEISPTFALDADHLREVMHEIPHMTPGGSHYWE